MHTSRLISAHDTGGGGLLSFPDGSPPNIGTFTHKGEHDISRATD